MGDRTVNLHRLLAVTVASCVILLCLSGTVSSQIPNPLDVDSDVGGNGVSLSFSDYSVSASSSDIGDRIPCVFRGDLKLNNDQWTIDSCTLCTCRNGTTDCDIISCGTAKCTNPVKITGECCPLCPYTMELYDLFNRFTAGTRVTEGKINKFKFAADVEIFKGRTSKKIRGENMWRIGAWVSRNSDGSGEKFSYNANVLSAKQRALEFSKAKSDYAPPDKRWNFNKLRYSFDATEGVCADFKYFCIKFNMTDDPEPNFDLDFTYTVYREEYERQTKCVRLGTCKGVVFTKLHAKLISPEIIAENTNDTQTTVKLKATTNKQLTTTVVGEDLWQVKTFFSKNTKGKRRRVNEQPQILTAVQDNQTLNTGENLVFKEMDFQVDLSGLICHEVPFMCFELAKNPAASIDYTFETQPVQDPFVDCLSMKDICKGAVFTELETGPKIV
ncbi:uncharacterized protein [Apostichopus japonicus]|uniref:uncharacterized protein n=1 Tax=Stichopus japonicus TaxID=307972 RepID=UPI003AB3C2DC